MKILRPRFPAFRNEEWFIFFTEFNRLVEKYGAEKMNIETLYIAYLVLYNQADEALELIRKSIETEKMNEVDRERDLMFRGFADAVKANLNHYDPSRREAAKKLVIVTDHYSNIPKLSGNEETGAIHNFIQELEQKHSEELEKLTLKDWPIQLEAVNNKYRTIWETRSEEIAQRTKYRMTIVRKEAEAIYRQIVERLEAMMIVTPKTEIENFINEFNVYIKERIDVIAQRSGIKGTKVQG